MQQVLFPVDEAPLERLCRRGSRALSDAELLCVLLPSGDSPARLEMAQEVLAKAGLAGLHHWEPERLLRRFGRREGATLLATMELTRRIARARMPHRQLMNHRDEVANYLFLHYHQVDQEVMGALYLDVRFRLIEERELYRGTIRRTIVEPRAILKPAFLCGATGLILFHTHPSGDPAPSTDDLSFTRRLYVAAQISGLALHDHLILGSHHRYVSLETRNALT